MQVLEHDSEGHGYVLALEAVKRAIETLAKCRSHEHLPGYLALLKRHSNELVGVRDIEEFYTDYLAAPGAPRNRPYLRPFLSKKTGALLLNRNLQGSYAPSSIRAAMPFSRIVKLIPTENAEGVSGVRYVLVDDHANQVLTEMLAGHKIPAISLAIFLFRDRCLRMSQVTTENLRAALREFLCIGTEVFEGEEIFDTLFRDDAEKYVDLELLARETTICPGSGNLELMVSEEKARTLTLDEMGLAELAERGPTTQPGLFATVSEVAPTDAILEQVQEARRLGFAGVILSGPPGTGKSWYAQQLGMALTGQWENVRSVQFHPSYQYEDFVVGYVANEDGRFELREREFTRLCRDAATDREAEYVLVIDEISRSDVVRIFGEALTYIATDKRDQPFTLACGWELTVPKNLFMSLVSG